MDLLSIIIPQYRTEQHIRLCLRSLRKYSQGAIEVLVIDNNSNDASLEYLRNLSWIKLIENPTQSLGSRAHAEALDLGVNQATGDWLCFFHSDTMVLKPEWDLILIKKIKDAHAVGLSTLERDINKFEPLLEKFKHILFDFRKNVKIWLGVNKKYEKIMSFCFIINKDIFLETRFSFLSGRKDIISDLYHEKIKGAHPFILAARQELEPLLWHTSNVTSILTGQIQEKSLVQKFNMKNSMLLQNPAIQEILSDPSLDF
ncbi:MAG: glycosyltransferase family 2 protein [Deltaproteobacteria bacterium]|nr:glycosyltransferase family 2 protein [Deltaproteobacteria bacterium]